MNILPKKSWHVRNKDNVAKVRKDEQEAKEKEKRRLQQVALAEQEARTELLRKKARLSLTEHASDKGVVLKINSNQPINFFQEIGPDGKPYALSTKNEEHEKEKKQEKEKVEKKIGLLTYLGQSSVETLPDDERPWYFKPPQRGKLSQCEKNLEAKDSKHKTSIDPLIEMKQYLKKKKHKHKKHKSKKTFNSKSLSSDDKLAKLRKERMEREAKEKQRSVQLLQKHYGIEEAENSDLSFAPKYSNQFNPHLARNNK